MNLDNQSSSPEVWARVLTFWLGRNKPCGKPSVPPVMAPVEPRAAPRPSERLLPSNCSSELKLKGILVKCQSCSGLTEEKPDAYKDVSEVVQVVHNAGIARKVAKLAPIAVMKG